MKITTATETAGPTNLEEKTREHKEKSASLLGLGLTAYTESSDED